MTSSTKQWWRRAAAALKDKRSLYLTRVASNGQLAEMEAAVIRATSHDDRCVDYKNAGRVFAWARTSPASLAPLFRALARRATRTRSWAVALKTLLLAHGVLLCSGAAGRLGRLPFDLSDFRDRSARPAVASGFSAFVRAYFRFLDYRSVLSSFESGSNSSLDCDVEMLMKMQDLLELLMQIRPYGDGMGEGLVVEAMNCVVIEIFDVYGGICRGIASFLVDVLGENSSACGSKEKMGVATEERRRAGVEGMRVVRRAAEQSEKLSSFFSLSRSLGVLNAAEIPSVESVAEEDIRELEALVRGGITSESCGKVEEERKGREALDQRLETVVTEEWEVFEEDTPPPPPPPAAAVDASLVNSIENHLSFLKNNVKAELLSLPMGHHAAASFAGRNLRGLISRNLY